MSIACTLEEYKRWEHFLSSYPNRKGIHTIKTKEVSMKDE